MDNFHWPNDVSRRTKLCIPTEYSNSSGGDNNNDDGICYIKYDNEKKLLLVVSNDDDYNETILDIIDPKDVIGAAVEIKLFNDDDSNNNNNIRSTTSFQNTTNNTINEDTKTNNEDDDNNKDNNNNNNNDNNNCGSSIFKPLNDDNDKIFMSCNNEPLSEIPYDTQAAAVLNIYVYPKLDKSKLSLLNWCGIKQYKPCPNTNINEIIATTTTTTDNNNNNKKEFGHRYSYHRRFQVAPAEDFSDVTTIVSSIRQVSKRENNNNNQQQQQQRLLVIVNPCSGTGQGEHHYKTIVSPMLEQAGIDHDVIITTYAKHAEELMKQQQQTTTTTTTDDDNENENNNNNNNDITNYDGIITIGGDGIFHEILQGIHSRSDSKEILKKLKFGIIGSGSANGLAKTLTHASKELCSPIDSTFLICKGQTSKIDLSKYQTSTTEYISFLTFAWSMIADIDIESEILHFLGPTRFDLWGVVCVLNLKQYKAKLSYLSPPTSSSTNNNTHHHHLDDNTMIPFNDPIPSPTNNNNDNNNNNNWITIEDNFYLLWASHVTHAGETSYQTPQCKLQDGIFTILIVRGIVSRYRMARILLGLENGSHVDMDGVEFIKCIAYRLEPISSGSFNDLDGEVIESGQIQGYVLPSAMEMFCNPA